MYIKKINNNNNNNNMGADYGQQMWLVYECVGHGKEEIVTYEKISLKTSLKKAAQRMGIPLSSINQIQYRYNPLNLQSSALDNNIPNGGIILIKLKK